MTQTLNASHTSVSRGELLAQEASTRKQAGGQNNMYRPRWITRHKSGGVGGIL